MFLETSLIHYIIHLNFIAFWLLLSNTPHTHTTAPLFSTPDALNVSIQSNYKVCLPVWTMKVFPYITKITAICESHYWYHPDETDSFLNVFSVGVPFCMELSSSMMPWRMKPFLSNFIATTTFAILTSAYSEKNSRGPHMIRGASAGLWLSLRSVETLTLIPVFARKFYAAVGVTVLLATALQAISCPFFARPAGLLYNSLDR